MAATSGLARRRIAVGVLISVVIIIGVAIFAYRSFESDDTNFFSGSETPVNKPVLAVLPFQTSDDDPQQDYFADGLSADLINDLDRLGGLQVIACDSIFVYKNQPVDPRQLAARFSVHYVLDGSVGKAARRVRINARLIDAATGVELWAERYDREPGAIFELQNEVIMRTVAALNIELSEVEQVLLERQPTTSFDAYDNFLRGQNLMRTGGYRQARDRFKRAVVLDPTFARAYAALARSYIIAVLYTLSKDPDSALEKALDLARQAKALDSNSAQIRYTLGNAYLLNRDYDKALLEARRAIEFAPRFADAYGLLARIYIHSGRLDEAMESMTQAMESSLSLSAAGLAIAGQAHWLAGETGKAIELLESARERNPEALTAWLYLILAYRSAGQIDEAEWEVEELRAAYPAFSVSRWARTRPYKDLTQLEELTEGLRRAGLR